MVSKKFIIKIADQPSMGFYHINIQMPKRSLGDQNSNVNQLDRIGLMLMGFFHVSTRVLERHLSDWSWIWTRLARSMPSWGHPKTPLGFKTQQKTNWSIKIINQSLSSLKFSKCVLLCFSYSFQGILCVWYIYLLRCIYFYFYYTFCCIYLCKRFFYL